MTKNEIQSLARHYDQFSSDDLFEEIEFLIRCNCENREYTQEMANRAECNGNWVGAREYRADNDNQANENAMHIEIIEAVLAQR